VTFEFSERTLLQGVMYWIGDSLLW